MKCSQINKQNIQVLDQKIRSLAQIEKDALAELVTELRHLDAIRGYEELGYSSLFVYLTKGVGYSAGQAQRRIDAARLSRFVPDLGEKLQSGTLDLHHVTTVSKAIRQASKTRQVSTEEKCEIMTRLENQTEAQTQKEVASFFDLPVITETKRSVQKDESVRFEITVTREVAELIEQAQALVSHSVPTKDLSDFLEYVSKRIIRQKTQPPRPRKTKAKPTHDAIVAAEVGDATPLDTVMAVGASTATPTADAMMAVQTCSTSPTVNAMIASDSRSGVPDRLHRQIRSRQPRCVACGTQWFPQTDHRQPRWADGTHEIANLQTLCGPCNRAKYHRESNTSQGEQALRGQSCSCLRVLRKPRSM